FAIPVAAARAGITGPQRVVVRIGWIKGDVAKREGWVAVRQRRPARQTAILLGFKRIRSSPDAPTYPGDINDIWVRWRSCHGIDWTRNMIGLIGDDSIPVFQFPQHPCPPGWNPGNRVWVGEEPSRFQRFAPDRNRCSLVFRYRNGQPRS